MSQGARNWPFLMLMILLVLAAASSKSVWRQRKAGIWRMSTWSAMIWHCCALWMSVRTGKSSSFLTAAKISRDFSRPMPLFPEIEERLALSNEDLKMKGISRRAQMSLIELAIINVWSSDSIWQGPAISANGRLLAILMLFS